MRLRSVDVEYKVCNNDDSVECLYEGQMCPKHKSEFRENSTKRIVKPRLILVDTDPPPYILEKRRACKSCGSLFENPPCPICNGETRQRSILVWVRTFLYYESLDELMSRESL